MHGKRVTYINELEGLMHHNKLIPKILETPIIEALSFYPQLKKVPITFKFKDDIKKSTMQAQPAWNSFFHLKIPRKYFILISKKFKITGQTYNTANLPQKVLTGWIGHELGHIMDYQTMNNVQLMKFGINYLFSEKSIVAAERRADTFAVKQGMVDYIMATKNFILNHAEISDQYKQRIKNFYLSPEEIMELVQ